MKMMNKSWKVSAYKMQLKPIRSEKYYILANLTKAEEIHVALICINMQLLQRIWNQHFRDVIFVN